MNIAMADFTRMTSAAFLAAVLVFGAFGRASQNSQQGGAAPRSNSDVRAAQQPSGFYCNLKALTPAERERHHQLTQAIAEAKLETKELPNGYAFRLQTERIGLAELAEWVAAEKKCCPFFDFEIALGRDGGPLWLRLTGAEGVKEFMRHELGVH